MRLICELFVALYFCIYDYDLKRRNLAHIWHIAMRTPVSK